MRLGRPRWRASPTMDPLAPAPTLVLGRGGGREGVPVETFVSRAMPLGLPK